MLLFLLSHSTPTGVLNPAQERLVVDGINKSISGTGVKFEDGVAKFEDAARWYMANAFIKTVTPLAGTSGL